MANTPNIDLVKPAGTDHALVSVLNSNSDKIDTFAGTTNQAIANLKNIEGIGNFSTLASVNSALTTLAGQMSDKETRPVMVSTTAAFSPFSINETYQGQIYKWSSNRYYVLLVSVSNTITGTYLLGTWSWQEVTNNGVSSFAQLKQFNGNSSTSVTFDADQCALDFLMINLVLVDSDDTICGSITCPVNAATNRNIKVFGSSSSQWGSMLLASDGLSATLNRTTANTAFLRVYAFIKKK